MKRVFLIVLDSLGIGQMPDAEKFGDKDCNTLKRISASKSFGCYNLVKMGLGNIEGVDYIPGTKNQSAAVCRLAESSAGKDTTTGHWEIAGIISKNPMPVYPNGFPKEIVSAFEEKTGRSILCNMPYSGTEVIKDFGEEHLKTGKLIVYTSADSVFQIAAHEKIIPPDKLYEYCETARKILCGKHAVGRVIARPFEGDAPNFRRTANRRDFSLKPTGKTLLDAIKLSGKDVLAVGKISDIFAGEGITEKIISHSNYDGMKETKKAQDRDFEGICFTNLVDFDMLYGHRQDVDGYAGAFTEFDNWLPEFISGMKSDDVLFITADHGCDPGDGHTDHTREYVPLIIYGEKVKPVNLKTKNTFADISATIADFLKISFEGDGKSFLKDIED